MTFWQQLRKKRFAIYLFSGVLFSLSFNPIGGLVAAICFLAALEECYRAEIGYNYTPQEER